MSDTLRLPPAYHLVALDHIDSTNEEAKRLADRGAEENTLIWAQSQSGGRGRRGRRWESPRGNLYFSLLLRPRCSIAQAAQLGMVAAVAIRQALLSLKLSSTEILLKWPNDVLANGRKVGGILLESTAMGPGQVAWLILGIGINVESHPDGTAYPATSLRAESHQSLSAAAVLESFGPAFLEWYYRWVQEGFAPIRVAWRDGAWKRGESIEVRLEGQAMHGVFADIDDQGALMLRLADGTERRITAADVFALPAS